MKPIATWHIDNVAHTFFFRIWMKLNLANNYCDHLTAMQSPSKSIGRIPLLTNLELNKRWEKIHRHVVFTSPDKCYTAFFPSCYLGIAVVILAVGSAFSSPAGLHPQQLLWSFHLTGLPHLRHHIAAY